MTMRASLNLNTGIWSYFGDWSDSEPFVQMSFQKAKDQTFNNLQFGFDVYIEEALSKEIKYPEELVVYENSDQEYLSSDLINLPSQKNIRFHFFATDSGVSHEDSVSFFSGGAPTSEAWVFDGEKWEYSPVEQEFITRHWEWSELEQKWVETI